MLLPDFIKKHKATSVMIGVRVGEGSVSHVRIRGFGFMFYGEYIVTEITLLNTLSSQGELVAVQMKRRAGEKGTYSIRALTIVDTDTQYCLTILQQT